MNIIEKKYEWNGSLNKRKSTKKIILHHAEASVCSAGDIHQWHLNRGWCGIGYHFFVRKDGSVYRGRPENVVGSHAKGSNSNSIGICAEGSYTKETMPSSQKQAIIELILYLKSKYGDLQVLRHNDVASTDCPGTNYPYAEIAKGILASNASSTPSQSIPTYRYKYTVGQRVRFSTCYNSSTAPNSKAIHSSKMSRDNGIITKIETGTKNPYLLDNGLCWVNDGDIREVLNVSKPNPSTNNKLGNYKIVASDLIVRDAPNGRPVGHKGLSIDGKRNDKDKDGALDYGTVVTISKIQNGWGKCPSGWLSMKYLQKV